MGLELVNGYKSGDARAKNIVRNSRNIVVPIVNPDGFEASRTAGELGRPGRRPRRGRRRHRLHRRRRHDRRRVPPQELPPARQLRGRQLPDLGRPRRDGVDPNRNYGGLWGGPGADATNAFAQNYRGPGPFSEPETRNIQARRLRATR